MPGLPTLINHREFGTAFGAALMLCGLFAFFPSFAIAEGEQGAAVVTPRDVNDVGASEIRINYHKRYPFAADAAKNDEAKDQKSGGGGSQTYEAYSTVKRLCKDDHEGGNPDAGTDVHYEQTTKTVTYTLPSNRYKEAFNKGKIKVYGLPCSDTQFQIIDRECRQRFLELFFDPEHWMWTRTTGAHMQALSAANSVGGAAESSFKAAFDSMNEPLINVANESAGVGGGGKGRSQGQAVFIILQMYKQVFMPMAVLLLLPGALLTQIKGMVGFSFLNSKEDASSPFEGFLRALIAIFLIPTTQLIVSYSIDVGNSLAGAVKDPVYRWIQPQTVFDWAKEQTFNPPLSNVANGILEPRSSSNSGNDVDGGKGGNGNNGNGGLSGGNGNGGKNGGGQSFGGGQNGFFNITFPGTGQLGQSVGIAISDFINSIFGTIFEKVSVPGLGGQGKSAGESEQFVTAENQLFLSSAMQVAFNGYACVTTFALSVLTSYQLVFMSYLLLMGPIAACFFAWPGGCGSLFRTVFTNWLNAVVVLSLWRFYWCVILAVMTQRILQVQPNASSPQEMMVFSCFLSLLIYIPFHPFNFNPGEIVSEMLDKATKGAGQATGQALPSINPIGANPGANGEHRPIVERRGNVATREFTRLSSGAAPHDNLHVVPQNGDGNGERGQGKEGGEKHQSLLSKGTRIAQAIAQETSVPPSSAPEPVKAPVPEQLPPEVESADLVALDQARQDAGTPDIQLVSPKSSGMIPLEPHNNPKFIATTTNSADVKNGVQSWQNIAAQNNLPHPATNTPAANEASNSQLPAGQNDGLQPAAGHAHISTADKSAAVKPPSAPANQPEMGRVKRNSRPIRKDAVLGVSNIKDAKRADNQDSNLPPLAKNA